MGGVPSMSGYLARDEPAVGPVDAHAVPRGAAEQLDHRDAERLRLDVNQRKLDARDGLGGNSARALAGAPQHVPEPHLERARVLPEQRRLEVLYRPNDAVGRAAVAALAVAGHALVRLDLDEYPGPPARVDRERIYVADAQCPTSCPVRILSTRASCVREVGRLGGCRFDL